MAIGEDGDSAERHEGLRRGFLLILITVLALAGWGLLRRSAPPEVPFTRVTRETIESALTTNGKVEPIEWESLRAERPGPVDRVLVHRGDTVKKGQVLVQMDTAEARSELASAVARIAGAQADAQVTRQGGRATDRTEIESSLNQARAELANAQRDLASLEKLAAKNAATQYDVTQAREAVQKIQLRIQSLESRRISLVSAPDREAAQARVREAQAAAGAARVHVEQGIIRSPMNGIVYQIELKPGAFLNAGDLVASIGVLNKLVVKVYVDEPELGRVAKGMPVLITWDALPGRQWKGEVDRVPTEVTALGTRQVGEVSCVIDNPDLTLLPGTNINAEIRSKTVQNAIALPKEALRREGTQNGVLKLQGSKVVWQPISPGISSVTRIQVISGLSEGDAVALPVDRSLKSGDEVKPVFR